MCVCVCREMFNSFSIHTTVFKLWLLAGCVAVNEYLKYGLLTAVKVMDFCVGVLE